MISKFQDKVYTSTTLFIEIHKKMRLKRNENLQNHQAIPNPHSVNRERKKVKETINRIISNQHQNKNKVS